MKLIRDIFEATRTRGDIKQQVRSVLPQEVNSFHVELQSLIFVVFINNERLSEFTYVKT